MLIQFEHVTRRFNGFAAVDDVSFTIGQGEIVGLLGHNGAGKTTIMKLLTGYLEPTSGEITVSDLRMGEETLAIQKQIGYLPENCPLWTDMSVIDFLSYQASLHGIPVSDQPKKIINAIRRTQLTDKAVESIRTLSKGYRQRVGVANAILKNPQIIILDEPTNGLDPTQTLHMRMLIKELAKTSTVILSTHILQEVQAICERVLIVRAGKLVTDGTLSELDRVIGLRIGVDRDEATMTALLESLAGVRSVQFKGGQNNQYKYIVDADPAAAPLIGRSICQAGFQLYEIALEKQSLEAYFRDDFAEQDNTAAGVTNVA